jgi:hypothetical protein
MKQNNPLSNVLRQTPSDEKPVGLSMDNFPNFTVNRPFVDPGTTPKVVIDQVSEYSATVHPLDNSGIYQPTTQIAFGRAFNVDSSKVKIIVYALTNQYYIQPLDYSYVKLSKSNSSSEYYWVCPANTGKLRVLLTRQDFKAPTAYPKDSPPQADGTLILAMVEQP